MSEAREVKHTLPHLKRRASRLLVASLALVAGVCVASPGAEGQDKLAAAKSYKFVNGQWFDGRGFRRQTFYSVKGLLTRRPPRVVDETVDLANGYVVPPFGDAHSHHFDGPYNVAQQVQMYLRDGIFYAKVPGDVRTGAEKVAALVNTPTSVDVRYAHGVLTGNYSHPMMVYEGLALGFYGKPEQWQANAAKVRESRVRENDAYYIIDTQADLENKWPKILAGQPGFIKVMVLHSENYEERRKRAGHGEGIDPQLLPQIVARAHAASLTVSAHVDSAFDYRVALRAGVDEMVHMPGYYVAPADDVRTYQLTPEDARETARRQVSVIPTANLAPANTEGENQKRTVATVTRNLKLLKSAGVRFAIGTDSYGTDALREAMYLNTLGVFTNLELLKVWCEDTPRAIFPQRRIGHFKEGYEASFIVLAGDPLKNFGEVKNIKRRFKQGQPLATTVEREATKD